MKRYSFWIITSLFTFLLGIGAVLTWLYYDQQQIVGVEPVPLFENIQFKSFPGLSRKTSELSKGKSGYFPKNTWNGHDTADHFMNDWYGDFLKGLGEKSLLNISNNTDNTEVYRFMWLRTFHHPIFVRIERKRNFIRLFSKESNGAGGYEPGKVIRIKETTLDTNQWCEFLNLLEKSKYWQMPSEDREILGNDGSQWILEGIRENRYHIVDRWSPSDKSGFGEACIYLLKLSGVDTDKLGDELY